MTEKQEYLSRIPAVINRRQALLNASHRAHRCIWVIRLLVADIVFDIRAIFDFIREWFAFRSIIIKLNTITDEEFAIEHSRHFPVSPESLGVTPATQAEGEA